MADISTSGWDVVSITDLDTINTIINSDRVYPSEFSVSDSFIGTVININGKWGEWTVSSNASGGKVNIRCEIIEGSVVYSGKTISFNDSSSNSFVEIELLLKGIETDPELWVNNNSDIITDTTSCYQLMVDADNMVVVTDSGFTGPDIAADGLNLILPALFGEWFQDNMSAFRQIFSVIIIGLKTENSDFQWLYPSAYSYAANSSLDNSTTGFGVLTLIDGKKDTGSIQQSVDIQALNLIKPFGANLALVVSKAMFVKHILLAAAVSLIKDAKESDFTISETGLSLTNNREMLWQDFEEDEGKYISPVLPKESLILTLQSDYIHISIMGAHYRPRAGVTVYMGVEQNFRYKVEKNSSGEPVFVPDEEGLGDAVVSCSVKFDDWMNVLEITMGIIASIAALISLGTGVAGFLAARAVSTVETVASETTVLFEVTTEGVTVGESAMTAAEGASIAARIANGIISNPTIFNTVKIASVVTAATTGIVFSSVLISEAIYKGVYDDVPSFHHFASSITGSSIWPGMENIELKSASLADSFVIGLELK